MLNRSFNDGVSDSVVQMLVPGQLSRYSNLLRGKRQTGRSLSPYRVKNVLFSMYSGPILGSIQPPIQWVPGLISRWYSGRGVKLTIHLQLVLRPRKHGSIHPLPHTSSWHSA
jgi:hypothetical protein